MYHVDKNIDSYYSSHNKRYTHQINLFLCSEVAAIILTEISFSTFHIIVLYNIAISYSLIQNDTCKNTECSYILYL